jgi:hypothetical protein
MCGSWSPTSDPSPKWLIVFIAPPIGFMCGSFVPTWFVARALAHALGIPDNAPVIDQPHGLLCLVLFLASMTLLVFVGGLFGFLVNALILRLGLRWSWTAVRDAGVCPRMLVDRLEGLMASPGASEECDRNGDPMYDPQLDESAWPSATERAAPHPANVPGDYYVEDGCCLMCEVPLTKAPDLFGLCHDPEGWDHCYVKKQPVTADEQDRMFSAIRLAEAGCIRYRGRDRAIQERLVEAGEGPICVDLPKELKQRSDRVQAALHQQGPARRRSLGKARTAADLLREARGANSAPPAASRVPRPSLARRLREGLRRSRVAEN